MAEAAKNNVDEKKKSAPPYIAYQSLKTLTAGLQQNGLPPRIDKSLMSNFSGAVASQLMTALRFLDLIDEGDKPTASLKELVSSYNSDKWSPSLATVLKNAYRELFKIPLATASPAQFAETFSQAYEGEGDTLRKGMTFFLNAATDAGIAISPYITKNKKPRSPQSRQRTAKAKSKTKLKTYDLPNGDKVIEMQGMSEKDILLGMLDTNAMSETEQEAVWTLLKYLAKAGK